MTAEQRKTVAESVREFARLIAHGDDEHRAWLTDAAERYLAGERALLPEPALAETMRPTPLMCTCDTRDAEAPMHAVDCELRSIALTLPGVPIPAAMTLAAFPWTPTRPPRNRPVGIALVRRGLGDYQLIEPDDNWPRDATHYAEISPPPRSELPTLSDTPAGGMGEE